MRVIFNLFRKLQSCLDLQKRIHGLYFGYRKSKSLFFFDNDQAFYETQNILENEFPDFSISIEAETVNGNKHGIAMKVFCQLR